MPRTCYVHKSLEAKTGYKWRGRGRGCGCGVGVDVGVVVGVGVGVGAGVGVDVGVDVGVGVGVDADVGVDVGSSFDSKIFLRESANPGRPWRNKRVLARDTRGARRRRGSRIATQ